MRVTFRSRVFAILISLGLLAPLAATAAETGRHQRIGDVDIYYGILPAAVAGKHDPAHEERTMHGGVPRGKDGYHLIVSLFDRDGARITDADIGATVAELGMAGTRRKLEPMRIDDTVSFGDYFTLHGDGPHLITLSIRRPGVAGATEAVFEYRTK